MDWKMIAIFIHHLFKINKELSSKVGLRNWTSTEKKKLVTILLYEIDKEKIMKDTKQGEKR